jgi:hypothetical protein
MLTPSKSNMGWLLGRSDHEAKGDTTMTFKKYEPEMVCEFLLMLAEKGDFDKITSEFKDIRDDDIRMILKEVSEYLSKRLVEEIPSQRPQYSHLNLSQKAMSVVSCLSPREEMILFKSFKVL